MARPEIDIAVPAAPGVGAPTNIAAVNTECLVMNAFATPDDVVVLEQSFDGIDWQQVFMFNIGPQALVLDLEGLQVRARRVRGSGGAYNIQAVAQANGVSAPVNLAVPAVGLSANQDISAQPQWLNLHYGGTPADFIIVQVSIDGVNFAPFMGLQGGVAQTVPCGANQLNANKPQGGSGGAFNLVINGVPAKA